MRIVHPLLFEPILFEENKIPIWVIENRTVFRQIVFDLVLLSEGGNGDCVLSKNFDKLSCKDCLHVIYDFFHLEPSGKKLINAFQSIINRTLQDELLQESNDLNQQISAFLSNLSSLLIQPTCFAEGDLIPLLLKAVQFRLWVDGDSPAEKLISYIEILCSLLKNQCIVLVNAKSYFSDDELLSLYKMSMYQKWNILLLEPLQPEEPLENEKYYILDRDLCEIRQQ
ncbi:MAG: type II-A CRISPR-associated protein Csn2 [Ruminococcaceae bacterium]|nr:type II-A CRISPR-associated protein Csn2 [Oscillospiraceae bacterium]